MLRPACLLPAARLLPRHGCSGAGVSPVAWGLLLGAPALPEAGLSPAGDVQPATVPADGFPSFVAGNFTGAP